MASVNSVTLIGHLGKDPELKYLANGDAVCNATLATSEQWKDKNTGDKVEKTEWHRLVMFRRLAEIAGEYLKKGALIYVRGRLQTRKYEKDGVDHYATEIVVDDMKMLSSKQSSQDEDERPARAAKPAAKKPAGSVPDDFDEEIPF